MDMTTNEPEFSVTTLPTFTNATDDDIFGLPPSNFFYFLISLIAAIIWVVYLSFYNARVFGFLLSFVLNRFLKKYRVSLESISISILSGKLMFRKLRYQTCNYSVDIHDGWIIFRWWQPYTRFSSLNDYSQPDVETRLYLSLNGLDIHFYNNISAYGAMEEIFGLESILSDYAANNKAKDTHSKSSFRKRFSMKGKSKVPSVNSTTFRGEWEWRDLIPTIKMHITYGRVLFGASPLPTSLSVTFEDAKIIYVPHPSSTYEDLLLHRFDVRAEHFRVKFVQNKGYKQKPDDPPRNMGEGFVVMETSKIALNYYYDEPGTVPHAPEAMQYSAASDDCFFSSTNPSQGLNIKLGKTSGKEFTRTTNICYGPWADRQRSLIWKYFYPQNYKPLAVTPRSEPGEKRIYKTFDLKISLLSAAEVDFLFTNKDETLGVWHVTANAGSYVESCIPWTTAETGYTSVIEGQLMLCQSTASLPTVLPFREFIDCETFEFKTTVHYPLQWNDHQDWQIDITACKSTLRLLYQHKNFLSALLNDWSSSEVPDLYSFVPYTMHFNFVLREFEALVFVNQFNWIDCTETEAENAMIAVCGKELLIGFTLPFTDYLPDVVPFDFNFLATQLVGKFKLPETNTISLPLILLSKNAKLVEPSIYHETGEAHSEDKPVICSDSPIPKNVDSSLWSRIAKDDGWITAAYSPSLRLHLNYTNHPMPTLRTNITPSSRATGANVNVPEYADSSDLLGLIGTQEAEGVLIDILPDRPEVSEHSAELEFDAGSLDPDLILVELEVSRLNLAVYGPLVRLILNLKENYFGEYQVLSDMAGKPQSLDDTPETNKDTAHKSDFDERQYRQFEVALSIKLSDISGHLITHCDENSPPCPVIQLSRLAFEMDKRYTETKLQLLLSPAKLSLFEHKNEHDFSSGFLAISAVQFRGHALFSHEGLPMDSETLEYGWLMELLAGDVCGKLQPEQVVALTDIVETLIFTLESIENDLVRPRTFELCQHHLPQPTCNILKTADQFPCPRTEDVKYIMFRAAVDLIEVFLIAPESTLSFQLFPVRVATCSLHNLTGKQGVTALFQHCHLTQFTKLQQHTFLDSGGVSFGPVILEASVALPHPKYAEIQGKFLRKHDRRHRRLWFLYPPDTSVMSPMVVGKCGCLGGCRFFGPNRNGLHFLRMETEDRVFTLYDTCEEGLAESLFSQSQLSVSKPVSEYKRFPSRPAFIDLLEHCEEMYRNSIAVPHQHDVGVMQPDATEPSPPPIPARKTHLVSEQGSRSSLPDITPAASASSSDALKISGHTRQHSLDINMLSAKSSRLPSETASGMTAETIVTDTGKRITDPLSPMSGLSSPTTIYGSLTSGSEQNYYTAEEYQSTAPLSPDSTVQSLDQHAEPLQKDKAPVVHESDGWTKAKIEALLAADNDSALNLTRTSSTLSSTSLVDEDKLDDSQQRFSLVDLSYQIKTHIKNSEFLMPSYKNNLSHVHQTFAPAADSSPPKLQDLRLPLFMQDKRCWIHRDCSDLERPSWLGSYTTFKKGFSVRWMHAKDSRRSSIRTDSSAELYGTPVMSPSFASNLADLTYTDEVDEQEPVADSASKTSASLHIHSNVDVLLTPLVLDSLDFYIKRLVPLAAKEHPCSIIDRLQIKSLSLVKNLHRLKDKASSSPHATNKLGSHRSRDKSKSPSDENDDTATKTAQQDFKTNFAQIHVVLPRINVCLLQAFPMERVVVFDDLNSKCLSCVSLFSGCLDTISFKIHVKRQSQRQLLGGNSSSSPVVRTKKKVQDDALTDSSSERYTIESDGELSINSLHVQLRRLRKQGAYDSEILLTALPEHRSQVGFGFDRFAHDSRRSSLSPSVDSIESNGTLLEKEDSNSMGFIMTEGGIENIRLVLRKKQGFDENSCLADQKKLGDVDARLKELQLRLQQEMESEQNIAAKLPPTKLRAQTTDQDTLKSDTGDESQSEDFNSHSSVVSESSGQTEEEKETDKVGNWASGTLKLQRFWFNFAAPPSVPNRRNIEFTKLDWNMLSTASPAIEAWLFAGSRLSSSIKKFTDTRRLHTAAVVAFLMSESAEVRGIHAPQKTRSDLLSARSSALQEEPVCQLFCIVRRYIREYGLDELRSAIKPDTVPQILTLQKGILSLTRQWKNVLYVPASFAKKNVNALSQGHPYITLTALPSEPSEIDEKTSLLRAERCSSVSSLASYSISRPSSMVSRRRQQRSSRGLLGWTLREKPQQHFSQRQPVQPQEQTQSPPPAPPPQAIELPPQAFSSHSPVEGVTSQIIKGAQTLVEMGRSARNKSSQMLGLLAMPDDGDVEANDDTQGDEIGDEDHRLKQEDLYRWLINQDSGQIPTQPALPQDSQTDDQGEQEKISYAMKAAQYADSQELLKPLLQSLGLYFHGGQPTAFLKRLGGNIHVKAELYNFAVTIVDSIQHKETRRTDGSEIFSRDQPNFQDLMELEPGLTAGRARAGSTRSGDVADHSMRFALERLEKIATTHLQFSVNLTSIEQHVNMPLLRLAHQVFSMVQSIVRHKSDSIKDRSSDNSSYKRHRKQDSGSSTQTQPEFFVITKGAASAGLHSKSLPAERGEGSDKSFGHKHASGRKERKRPAALNLPPDLASQLADPAGSSPSIGTASVGEQVKEDTHACWKRLYLLLDLYSIVPETKTVLVGPPQLTVITEEVPAAVDNSGDKLQMRSFPTEAVSPGAHPVAETEQDETDDVRPAAPTKISPRVAQQVSSSDSTTGSTQPLERFAARLAPRRFSHVFLGESIPLVICGTAKIHEMRLLTTLSGLKLEATLRSLHSDLNHKEIIKGVSKRKFTETSGSAQIGWTVVELSEDSPEISQSVVVRLEMSKSEGVASVLTKRSKQENRVFMTIGKICVNIPHHPVKLHSVVARKREKLNTVVEELRFRPATNLRSSMEPASFSNLQQANQAAPRPVERILKRQTPIVVSTIKYKGVVQGLSIGAKLLPSLEAKYQMGEVSSSGFYGATKLNFSALLSGHSLSFASKVIVRETNLPSSANIELPPLFLQGTYTPETGREITREQLGYLVASVEIGAFEHSLSTDLLNHLVFVQKVFVKEVNEVIQRVYRGSVADTTKRPTEGNEITEAQRQLKPFKYHITVKLKGIQITATTPSAQSLRDCAVRLETGVVQLELFNQQNTFQLTTSGSSTDLRLLLFFKASVDLSLTLGMLVRNEMFEEAESELLPLSFFKTKIAVHNVPASQTQALVSLPGQVSQTISPTKPSSKQTQPSHYASSSATSRVPKQTDQDESLPTITPSEASPTEQTFRITLTRPIVMVKPVAFDQAQVFVPALIIWLNYKNAYDFWQEQRSVLDKEVITATQQVLEILPALSSSSQHSGHPVSAESSSSASLSGLFFQLTVVDLGICIPLISTTPNAPVMSSSLGLPRFGGHDNEPKASLVLTLETTQISARILDAIVCGGLFQGFCLRFADDLEPNLDDWKPPPNQNGTGIMNSCIVPHGTYEVSSKTVALRKGGVQPELNPNAKWVLMVSWDMKGIDINLDWNIGRRLSVLWDTLTSLAGEELVAQPGDISTGLVTGSVAEGDEDETDSIGDVHRTEIPQFVYDTTLPPLLRAQMLQKEVDDKEKIIVDFRQLGASEATIKQEERHLNVLEAIMIRLDVLHRLRRKSIRASTLRDRLGLGYKPPSRLQPREFDQRPLGRLRPRRTNTVASRSVKGSRLSGHTRNWSVDVSDDQPSQRHSYAMESFYHGGQPTILEDKETYHVIEEDPEYELLSLDGDPFQFSPEYLEMIDNSYYALPASSRRATFRRSSYSEQPSTSLLSTTIADPSGFGSRVKSHSRKYSLQPGELSDVGEYSASEEDLDDEVEKQYLSLATTRDTSSGTGTRTLRTDTDTSSHTTIKDTSSVKSGDSSVNTLTAQTAPAVDFELEVRFRINYGRCELHPRIKHSAAVNDNLANLSRPWLRIDKERDRMTKMTKSNTGSRSRQKQMAPQQPSIDTTVFFLPRVDVKVHYDSMTDNNPAVSPSPTSETAASQSSPLASSISANQLTPPAALDRSVSRKALSNKSAALFAWVSLQSLPEEMLISPSLLDFLEQALESLPVSAPSSVSDDRSSNAEQMNMVETMLSSIQSDDSDLSGSYSMANTSTAAAAAGSFPVDIVVYLCVQPSTIKFNCLPTSRVECLLRLPSLTVQCSTIGPQTEPLTPAAFLQSMNEDSKTELSRHSRLEAARVRQQSSAESEGVHMLAMFEDFSLYIYHPYGGHSKAVTLGYVDVTRPAEAERLLSQENATALEVNEGAELMSTRKDALSLNLKSIQLTISRRARAPAPSSASSPDAGRLSTSPQFSSVQSDKSIIGSSVNFSMSCDVGPAIFKYDMHRLSEILSLSKSWYRRSLARRLFIGEETAEHQHDKAPVLPSRHHRSSSDSVKHSTPIIQHPAGAASHITPTAVRQQPTHPPPVSPRSSVQFALSSDTSRAVRPLRKSMPPGLTRQVAEDESSTSHTQRTPWETLVEFGFTFSQLDIDVSMANVMGDTLWSSRSLKCNGRLCIESSGKQHVELKAGLDSSELDAHGGIIGANIRLGQIELSAVTKKPATTDSDSVPPSHKLHLALGVLESKLDYMGTSTFIARLSGYVVSCIDSWKLVTETPSRVSPDEPISAVFIHASTEWDNLHLLISRSTANELSKTFVRLREFFMQQIENSRKMLTGVAAVPTAPPRHRSSRQQAAAIRHHKDSLIQHPPLRLRHHRHWQKVFNRLCASRMPQINPESVLVGGRFDMHGANISLACFHGINFRAKSWAVFMLREPSIVFATEAKKVIPASKDKNGDTEVHTKIIQTLLVQLGHEITGHTREDRASMAIICRLTRKLGTSKTLNFAEIKQWFRYAFSSTHLKNIQFPGAESNDPSDDHETEIILELPSMQVNLKTEHDQPMAEILADDSDPDNRPDIICTFFAEFDHHIYVSMDAAALLFLHDLVKEYMKEDEQASSAQRMSIHGLPDRNQASGDESHRPSDWRNFVCSVWHLEPTVRLSTWGKKIEPVGVDYVLKKLGFEHARTTIPKWTQRGVMDGLDSLTSIAVEALILWIRNKDER